jgi:hypothetical protein
MKKLIIVILGIIFIGFMFYFSRSNQSKIENNTLNNPIVDSVKPITLCFYKESKSQNNLSDVSWLRMNLSGDKVDGEFQNLPAEKDKKVGKFEGTVSKVDPNLMGRTALVWWNSMAEGMQTKEQLQIVFGEGDAQIGFGEMVDRGDGVYIYKDLSKLTYGDAMTDVNCDDIPTKLAVVNIQGESCYVYNQVATVDAPYKVDEYLNIKVSGDKVVGTKKGNQSGPDMTNGYTGSISGTLSSDTIKSVFSYVVEGSKNNEQEIYKITPSGLDKLRYPLIDKKGVLTPDTSKEYKTLSYKKISC